MVSLTALSSVLNHVNIIYGDVSPVADAANCFKHHRRLSGAVKRKLMLERGSIRKTGHPHIGEVNVCHHEDQSHCDIN